MSPGTSVSSALAALCPAFAVSRTWPMCETSNRPAARAGLGMLGQDAGRILHRHLVAGERHEARAQFPMQRIQRRALEGPAVGSLKTVSDRVALSRRKDCAVRDPLCPET